MILLNSQKLPYTITVSGFLSVGYFGSDFYNIYLEDRFVFAKTGLSIGDFINYYTIAMTLVIAILSFKIDPKLNAQYLI